MKLIIVSVILAFAAASVIDPHNDEMKISLNNVFNDMLNKERSNDVTDNQLKCARKRLNLKENGEKMLELDPAHTGIYIISMLCSNESVFNEKTGEKFNMHIKEFSNKGINIVCVKRRLKVLDPSSDLLEDFIDDENIECNRKNLAGRKMIDELHGMKKLLRDPNFSDCNITTEFDKIILNLAKQKTVAEINDAKELFAREARKLFEDVFKCFIDKMNAI